MQSCLSGNGDTPLAPQPRPRWLPPRWIRPQFPLERASPCLPFTTIGANSRASAGSGGDEACEWGDLRSWDLEAGAEVVKERDFEFGAGLDGAEHKVAGDAAVFTDGSA